MRTRLWGKWKIPSNTCWPLASLPCPPPNLLVTLLLGKRPSRENPAGSLRILHLKGSLRSAVPFFDTRGSSEFLKAIAAQDGFALLTKLQTSDTRCQLVLSPGSYLMILRDMRPFLFCFCWLLPAKVALGILLGCFKNIWMCAVLRHCNKAVAAATTRQGKGGMK